MRWQITKLDKGWYRLSNGTCFANIHKGRYSDPLKSKWYADVRYCESGNLFRYAGIWDTRQDAIDEVQRLIEKEV